MSRYDPAGFSTPPENAQVKTPDQLFDLYLKSAGRGASFLLNVPPDRRGLIYENDAASLAAFGKIVQTTFSRNLAAASGVKSDHARANASASNLLDGSRSTYWSPADSITTPNVVFEFAQPVEFNLIRVREYLALGQRVASFAVEVWQNGSWILAAKGTSIGLCRILQTTKPLKTTRVRLRITESPVPAALSEFGLYLRP